MGRPPCCDKVGVKKGPWTPEEDIMLVSYVQEHGPGNWRAVPNSTGLRRCSKSCRLRWTNYLRPGIRRGGFTDHEEKMIIQLQALLGNKWAAIASYLPERTDNDIKNYWNTHLKKKLKKLQTGSGHTHSTSNGFSDSISKGQWERMLQSGISTAKQALHDALSVDNKTELHSSDQSCQTQSNGLQRFPYASSTENIARLLKGWVKNTPKAEESKCSSTCSDPETRNSSIESKPGPDFEASFGFENFETSNSDEFSRSGSPSLEIKSDPDGLAPLSVLENWLLDDQGKDYLCNFSFDDNPDLF